MFLRRHPKDPPTVIGRTGEIQLHDRLLFADPASELVHEFLARVFALDQVSSIEIDHGSQTAVIRFSNITPTREMLMQLTAALRESKPIPIQLRDLLASAEQHRRTTNVFRMDGSYIIVPTVFGMTRLVYLTLGSVSFGMSILGVALPGIPTVPFVLLTSYFLLRSSPALNERLFRSRLFGPILRDWHKYGAVRPRVKWISICLTLVILVVSVLLAGIAGPLLVVVLVMAMIGIYLILRLPTLKEPKPSMPDISKLGIAGAT